MPGTLAEVTDVVVEAVVDIAHVRLGVEELVYRCEDLNAAIADLEKLNNEVQLYLLGQDKGRAHKFCIVFGAAIKPAYVRRAGLRVSYPNLD